MASRRITIHDLTEDSCSEEYATVATSKFTTSRQPAREPFGILQNDARPASKGISTALKSAIATLSEDRLREELETLCRQHDAARKDLEKKLLVTGREVSRYHADSDSENEQKEEEEESDTEGSKTFRSLRYPKTTKSVLPIKVADDEWTPRFAKCENCGEEFDVTENDERRCHWHTGKYRSLIDSSTTDQSLGKKSVNYDSDFWADHDENCHGSYESYEDDSEAQEGFTWPCCETTGDNEGCKTTKHKAEVNVLNSPIMARPMNTTQKSMASREPEIWETEIHISDIKWTPSIQRRWIQCGQCLEEYDPTANEGLECQYHPGNKSWLPNFGHNFNFSAGPKVVNSKAEVWRDHDEDSNGPREMFMDESSYSEGFIYECCGRQGDDAGCEEGSHVPDDEEVPALPVSKKRKAEEEISQPATYMRLF